MVDTCEESDRAFGVFEPHFSVKRNGLLDGLSRTKRKLATISVTPVSSSNAIILLSVLLLLFFLQCEVKE